MLIGTLIGTLLHMCREESLISVFESNTYSVVNIFDISLRVSTLKRSCLACYAASVPARASPCRAVRACSYTADNLQDDAPFVVTLFGVLLTWELGGKPYALPLHEKSGVLGGCQCSGYPDLTRRSRSVCRLNAAGDVEDALC